MANDWLWRLLRRFGRPPDRPDVGLNPMERAFDERIDRVERTQEAIKARLELLERQADPRRLRRDG